MRNGGNSGAAGVVPMEGQPKCGEGFFAVNCSVYSLVKGVGRKKGSCLLSGGSGEVG